MISGWRPLSVPFRPRQHIEERPMLINISTIFYSAFLAAKRLMVKPPWVSTDVADKHARYISEIIL